MRSAQLHDIDFLNLLVGTAPRKRMTASKLAAAVPVSRSFISQLMTGKVNTCTPKVAARIARELGVGIDTLFAPITSTTKHHEAGQELSA